MKGFIRIHTSDEAEMYIAVDEISSFGPDDKYHPNQTARLMLKDGRSVRTSWRYNSELIAAAIRESGE